MGTYVAVDRVNLFIDAGCIKKSSLSSGSCYIKNGTLPRVENSRHFDCTVYNDNIQ